MAETKDLTIRRGETFSHVVRWGTVPIIYKAITAISKAAPAVITCTGHGVPPGWPVAVSGVSGMTQINAASAPPRTRDYHAATVVTADSVSLNDVDASMFSTYLSGGFLQYYTPADLTNYAARMTLKDYVGGTVLDTLTSANGKILISTSGKTVTILIDAVSTAGYSWDSAVYDLELYDTSSPPNVVPLIGGNIIISPEVTT